MTKYEHMLTIVEPTPGGDSTLDLAHETVERGGSASVVMVITDRVQRDIRDFAQSENLDRGVAQAQALDQLAELCVGRIGGSPHVATHFGDVAQALRQHVTADTTVIAVPERLAAGRRLRRLASKSGIPMVISPKRAA